MELTAGKLPAGIAMMNAVHDRALADGVAVIHNITTPEIGMIQRMHGFRALSVSLDQLHLVFAPTELRQLRQTPSRARAARSRQPARAAARILRGLGRAAAGGLRPWNQLAASLLREAGGSRS